MRCSAAVVGVGIGLALAGCRPSAPTSPAAPARPVTTATKAAPPPYPPGFGVLRASLGATGQTTEVTAARADPRLLRVRVVAAPKNRQQWPRAEELVKRHVALAAINGGYFDDQNRPLGLVVSDHEVLQRLRRADWGVFALRGGRAEVVHTKKFAGTSGVQQALQCGPRLVADGQPTQLKESLPDWRAAVGVDGAGCVVLAATTRGQLSLRDFAKVLARPVDQGGLGCRDATNLDGGPSAQLCIPGAANLRGAYGMPTHILVLPPVR